MATRFDSMTARLRAAWKPLKKPTTARAFRCQCGRPVFFRNSQCLSCKTPLGYDPQLAQLLPLEPARRAEPIEPGSSTTPDPSSGATKSSGSAPPAVVPSSVAPPAGGSPTGGSSTSVAPTGDPAQTRPTHTGRSPIDVTAADPPSTSSSRGGPSSGAPSAPDGSSIPSGEIPLWRPYASAETGQLYQRCSNFDSAAGCNWLIAVASPSETTGPSRCKACALNRIIPDLTVVENQQRWAQLELAKRRLVSQLIALGLPVVPKSDDADHGLVFDFLASAPDGPAVMTGHASGVITLNVDEADDAKREQIRTQMREPYRTLLGHFRHEIGHYYWDLLIAETPWLSHVRALFGDDRQDYSAALKSNYDNGPPVDWPQRFVSSYASSHPWEDWAETWAHYLHMVDTVDTALSFGIDGDEVELDADPWGPDALCWPQDPGAEAFLGFLNAWVELTAVLNEMSRSMGEHDFYPFVLPRPSVAKLQLIHLVIHGATPPSASPSLAACIDK